jgi:spore maturation protein CgeB
MLITVTTQMSEILHHNNEALLRFQPWLSKLMNSKGVSLTSTLTKRERLIVHKGNSINLTNFETACQNDVLSIKKDSTTDKPLIWVGLVSPSVLVDVLESTRRPIILLEKNPGLLYELLSRYDVSAYLTERRLQIPNPLKFVTTSKNARSDEAEMVCFTPFDTLYRDIYNLYQRGASGKSHIDVMIEGELFMDDWYETLVSDDIPAYFLHPNWYPLEFIVDQLSNECVKRVWSINRIKKLPEMLSVLKKPYCIYEIDPDLSDLTPPSRHDTTTLFCYRKSRTQEYQKLGWDSHYLPLASNPKRFKPFHTPKNNFHITFVGTSMWTNAQKLISSLKLEANSEQRSIIEQFEQNQRNQPETYLAGLFSEKLSETGLLPPVSLTLESILREYSGAAHRSFLLMNIAGKFGVQVWGNEDWQMISKRTDGFDYMGKAKHLTEVPAIYAQSKINVDIGRIYQQDIATMRVFDVITSKKALITNYQDGVPAPRLFEEPLVSYSKADEMLERIEEVLSWSNTRYSEHTETLYQELLEKHTFGDRLKEMLRVS